MKTKWLSTNKLAVLLVGVCGTGLGLMVSCSEPTVGDKTICLGTNCRALNAQGARTPTPTPTAAPTASPTPVVVIPHDAKTVLTMLKDDCVICHGNGKDKRSYWPMAVEFDLPYEADVIKEGRDPATVSTFESVLNNSTSLERLISKIESDQFSVEVYQSIENNLRGMMDGKPKGMPYMNKLSGEKAESYKRLLAWFQSRLPFVVADARSKYHIKDLSIALPVDYQYSCTNLVSSRTFLNRLTQDALGRTIRSAELDLFASGYRNLDAPVTKEIREQAVNRLAAEWKDEFLAYGVKQFAERLSSSDTIRESKLITDSDLKEDIAGEFYQLVKARVLEGKSYPEILSSPTVFATKKTAPYYGKDCTEKVNLPANSAKKYVECTMDEPRGTFFTTLAFLSSKPSAIFFENNNYGRVAAMNEVIRGETLLPNTQGETGDKVKDLPQCLVTTDYRVLASGPNLFAPRGTASVPATGNFCQGCHLGRQLASGAIAFRPFGPIGEKLSREIITAVRNGGAELSSQDVLLRSFIIEAESKLDINDKVVLSGNNWANMPPGATEPQRVDAAVIADWLNIGTGQGQERGCIQEQNGDVTVTKVEDLYKYYVKDTSILARGLSRIVPRAMSNLNATNQEIIEGMTKAWKDGGGQLLPMFQAYFKSETFSCASSGGM